MMTDQHFITQGYTPVHTNPVTSLDQAGSHGIDHVFEKNGQFYIVESKFSSQGASSVSRSNLSRATDTNPAQMTDAWVKKNLVAAVGETKAEEILAQGYNKVLSGIDGTGAVVTSSL